jgi:hypothetical protein
MFRVKTSLAALTITLGLCATGQAQPAAYIDNSSYFYGPGSTVGGDQARGMGALYQGLGQYNYNTARANAINAQTLMQYNEYVYACRKNWNLERLQRVHAKAEHNKAAYSINQKRLREAPGENDIMTGAALNVLMEDISGLLLGPSVMSYTTRSFEGALVPRIPFQVAYLGGIISLRRLTVQDDWPLGLRDKALEADRAAYTRAVDNLLDHAHEGKLTVTHIKALQAAVERLRADARPLMAKADPTIEREARHFLDDLAGQAARLQAAQSSTMLVEIDRYSGTTVGEFVEFMQRFNLQFGPAETPAERDLYARLFTVLKQEQIALAGAAGMSEARSLPPGATGSGRPGAGQLPPGARIPPGTQLPPGVQIPRSAEAGPGFIPAAAGSTP